MANEIKVGTEETIKDSGVTEVEETEVTETEEDIEGEKKDEKPKESLEARRARLERQLKQLNKKLGVEAEEKPNPSKLKTESDEFNEGQLAYLFAQNFKTDEDIEFVQKELKKSGNNLRELLANEYFQAKDKVRRDTKAAFDAIPSKTNRSTIKTIDDTEIQYAKWMGMKPQEGEDYLATLPRDMKQKLINLRLKKTKEDNQFTDNPVVGHI